MVLCDVHTNLGGSGGNTHSDTLKKVVLEIKTSLYLSECRDLETSGRICFGLLVGIFQLLR